MTVSVRPATTDGWHDVRAAFGRRGDDPGTCWCQRFIGRAADGDNREALHRQIDAADTPVGLIAYLDDVAVGWSRVALRVDLPGVVANRALRRVLPDDPAAWWVACFSVHARSRGQGVGTALLAAGIEHARAHGASALEGHPVDVERLQAGKVGGSAVFTGTLAMFQKFGFVEIGRTFATRPVMRLAF